MSLFGGGEDVGAFAQSKMEQFEEQMKKITAADESYSADKLRALLREANEVIRDQLSLLQTVVAKNPYEGDALSFLDENEDEEMEVESPSPPGEAASYLVCVKEGFQSVSRRSHSDTEEITHQLRSDDTSQSPPTLNTTSLSRQTVYEQTLIRSTI